VRQDGESIPGQESRGPSRHLRSEVQQIRRAEPYAMITGGNVPGSMATTTSLQLYNQGANMNAPSAGPSMSQASGFNGFQNTAGTYQPFLRPSVSTVSQMLA
jgi:hypothetical protein